MALTKWAFIYTLGDPAADIRRDEIGSDVCRLIAIGVPRVADAAAVAADLAEEGVELIELCGAFDAGGLNAVAQATGGAVPTGAVFYGGGAVPALHALFGG